MHSLTHTVCHILPVRTVLAGLHRLGPPPYDFAAVKVSHHGSRNNTNLAFCKQVRSPHWLISSNGARFGHPHPEALARIITTQERPTFHLNYESETVRDLVDGAGSGWRMR